MELGSGVPAEISTSYAERGNLSAAAVSRNPKGAKVSTCRVLASPGGRSYGHPKRVAVVVSGWTTQRGIAMACYVRYTRQNWKAY